MTNRMLAYALLALLYAGAGFAALVIYYGDIPAGFPHKAIYFAAMVAAIGGAAVVHALLARSPRK